MIINTKFDIGEVCYTIWQNVVVKGTIEEMIIKMERAVMPGEQPDILFLVRLYETHHVEVSFNSKLLFKTRAELSIYIAGLPLE